jgi:triphosphatase
VPERGADPTNIEVEWQLDAIDLRPVERWLATFPRVVAGSKGETVVVTAVSRPVKRTVDVYLDTADWRIGRAGFVLRIRSHDDTDEDEVTLKDTSPAIAGLRRRIEVSESVPVDGLEALGPDGPVGRRLRALAGHAPLGQLLEVRTRRHPYHLHAAPGFLGEVDLDDTIIVVGDDQYPVRMRRVEIEAESAFVELLAPLVDQLRRDCSLQPALLSKFEVGLLALGLKVPTLPDLGPTALDAEPSVGSVAYAVLRRHLGSMLAHDAGTRLGEDIEQLHDMRVATRRLRAALALFSAVLPDEARRLRDELGWLATELGAVRDLDVQLERLDGWRHDLPPEERGALADLARLLGRERDVARESMLNSLDSARYSQLVTDFTSLVRPGIGQASGGQVAAAHAPAAAVVPGLILARHRSAATAARRARRSGEPEDFHRLRILCKRLRYALEFVSEIYDGQTRGVVRRVVTLQDCLGVMQDAQVAAARLHSLALADNSGLSPATVFAMGRVAERYQREAERVAGTLPDHLSALKSPQWRKLKKLMERRRQEAGPPETWSPGPSPTDRSAVHAGAPGVPAASGPPSPPLVTPPPPHPGAVSEHDSDWDDEDAPVLRSVPLGPQTTSGPAAPSEGEGSGSEPDDGAPDVRRRKEPVFLPAPPSPGRPSPARPVPRTEPPEDHQNRSFPDRS